MTFLDELRQLKTEPKSIEALFRGDYRDGVSDVYVFVEGKADLSFYLPVLRRSFEGVGEVFAYQCSGKRSVIELIPRIRRKLDQVWRGLFFLDKDIDDFCNENCIEDEFVYVTEFYSIENYIVCHETIRILWADLFKLPQSDARLEFACERFKHVETSFCLVMHELMSRVLWARRNGMRVVLNEVRMDKVVDLDEGVHASFRVGWETHVFQDLVEDWDVFDLSEVRGELAAFDPRVFVRGKFHLWLFVKYLQRVMLSLGRTAQGTGELRLSYPLTEDTIVDLVAPRLPISLDLKKFLDEVHHRRLRAQ